MECEVPEPGLGLRLLNMIGTARHSRFRPSEMGNDGGLRTRRTRVRRRLMAFQHHKEIQMKGFGESLKVAGICMLPICCMSCGPANESTLKGESRVVDTKPEMQGVKTYGDLLNYRMKEAKEKGKTASQKSQ